METWLWITSIAALIGVWLNIHRHVAFFYLWLVTNFVWTIADFRYGLYAQAALQAVYVCLSAYGIYKWSSSHGR